MTAEYVTTAVQEAAAVDTQRIISALPPDMEITREVAHKMMELAFLHGALFAHGTVVERFNLHMAQAEGGLQ
jgi:hypothetical protein